jgi:hypothetical protein
VLLWCIDDKDKDDERRADRYMSKGLRHLLRTSRRARVFTPVVSVGAQRVLNMC